MTNVFGTNSKFITLQSEWIEDAQVLIRVREIGNRAKFLVDITEISGSRMPHRRTALKVAREVARRHGASSVDASELCNFRTDRKISMADGSESLLKIRRSTFAFAGVN